MASTTASRAAAVKAYFGSARSSRPFCSKQYPRMGDISFFQRRQGFSRQQASRFSEGMALLLQMQFPQGFNGNIRPPVQLKTGKTGA